MELELERFTQVELLERFHVDRKLNANYLEFQETWSNHRKVI